MTKHPALLKAFCAQAKGVHDYRGRGQVAGVRTCSLLVRACGAAAGPGAAFQAQALIKPVGYFRAGARSIAFFGLGAFGLDSVHQGRHS